MKKLLMGAALSAMTILAQNAKVETQKDTPQAAPSERQLSETEALKLQLIAAKVQLLQDRYKIPAYNDELQPLSAEQLAIAKAVCASVGVPEDKINTECGLNLGIGADGKPLLDASGKPAPTRVWNAKPQPPPIPLAPTEKK